MSLVKDKLVTKGVKILAVLGNIPHLRQKVSLSRILDPYGPLGGNKM